MEITTTEDMTRRSLFDSEEQAHAVMLAAKSAWPEHQWKVAWIRYLNTPFWCVRTRIDEAGFRLYVRKP